MKAQKITKTEFCKLLQANLMERGYELTLAETWEVTRILFNTIFSKVVTGQRVALHGIGAFWLHTSARSGKKIPKFKPSLKYYEWAAKVANGEEVDFFSVSRVHPDEPVVEGEPDGKESVLGDELDALFDD